MLVTLPLRNAESVVMLSTVGLTVTVGTSTGGNVVKGWLIGASALTPLSAHAMYQ